MFACGRALVSHLYYGVVMQSDKNRNTDFSQRKLIQRIAMRWKTWVSIRRRPPSTTYHVSVVDPYEQWVVLWEVGQGT
jgi:hypothetical protein